MSALIPETSARSENAHDVRICAEITVTNFQISKFAELILVGAAATCLVRAVGDQSRVHFSVVECRIAGSVPLDRLRAGCQQRHERGFARRRLHMT